MVIISVSNRFNDLVHLKDKILKAVDSVSNGEIEHDYNHGVKRCQILI